MKNILIDKANLQDSKVSVKDSEILTEGQIRVEIDHFAFTSNNVTYAVLGESFKYWEFFPSKVENLGIIPVWGFADIVESHVDQLDVGERIFGYFPMSSELIMVPKKISEHGFMDGSIHRQDLAKVYNSYERVLKNEHYLPDLEPAYMIFKPLFGTSFLLNSFFETNDFFNAQNIVITSASSKTAIALAYLFNQTELKKNIIGLTSASNLDFVRSLNCYDVVLSYDEIKDLEQSLSCIIDFAGNKKIMIALQTHLLPNLKFCSVVGISHWNQQVLDEKLPFRSELFFAPSYAVEKIKEWGIGEYNRKFSEVFTPFMYWSKHWMEVERVFGGIEIIDKYNEVLEGNINPKQAIIMSL